MRTSDRTLEAAILGSLAAGAIHLAVAEPHLREYPLAGLFMLVTGLVQVGWGLAAAMRTTTRSLVAGIAGNASLVLLWAVTRVIGMPLGPNAGMREDVHGSDLLAVGLELLVIIGCSIVLRPDLRIPRSRLTALAVTGAVCAPIVASHDPARERLTAAAGLLLSIVAIGVLDAMPPLTAARLLGGISMRKTRLIFAMFLTGALVLAPVAAVAGATRTPRGDISAEWNGELTRSNGVRRGRGTVADPYVISGWSLNNISLRDTTKAIIVENNTINGVLRLNWIGSNIIVRNNTIGDLRVNENISRWGDPASGEIEGNTIAQVGQLRHFDGMFMHNTVGVAPDPTLQQPYPDVRAVNFDGFNGAHFAHNTIYGYVDARLHGHHHASSFSDDSHLHSMGPSDDHVDHTKRYHKVLIERNRIYTSAPYALAYLDTNHAGNDRTATSETNPYLNAPHVHYTRVAIEGNRLTGAGLLVNVFNSGDARHRGTPRGLLDIVGNRVILQRDALAPAEEVNGIEVRNARDLSLRLHSNTINGPVPLTSVAEVNAQLVRGTGIMLNEMDRARVSITNARVTDQRIGIKAVNLRRTVSWAITGLTTSGVNERVSYNETVANPPKMS